MSDAAQSLATSGIAIVGMAGRFPGARDCDQFWQNLREGREGLSFFTDDELAAAGCALGPHHEKRVRSRGVVSEADFFDAAFFGYSPKEAEIMDPQQRLFLEVAWSAFENAGVDPDRVPGAVGVFAGASINTYYPNNIVSRPDVLGPFGVFPAVVLNEKDFLATRVAYKLNLRGPALSVQTACSTSLVAVCNACQSLLSYESDLALAGGVAINYPHCHSYIHEEGGMIATDGHCRPFDKHATGTLFSDGVGVVVLKRLDDAVADGDTILAVIRGFAVNNDGADKAGFTAPSVNGQARVVQMAQALADVTPDSISYIEAHGTATPLGDPIEIAALTQAFRAGTDATQFCAIGSVKSNIGHLDVAAGIAGLIKAVLALEHGEIPATLHFTEPNPHIDFPSTPFFVVDKLTDWTRKPGVPRRAGVSSFGIGGTNAHVVLEEAPRQRESGPSRSHQLMLLSARTPGAVETATANLAEHLRTHPELAVADVAHTLQVGRRVFTHRRAVVCRDRAEALDRLGPEHGTEHPVLAPARHDPPVAFMFPGQGAQRVNMGRDLYDNEPLYRTTVDDCARVLVSELGLDLREVLFPPPEKTSWAEEQIVQTRITQPALFVTEYALAQLWMSWGVRPAAMIGHSVGEYVAACLAGVFTLEDGLRLIAARGRLIQSQPKGTMLAVMAGEEDVRPFLGDGVSIAAVNAPGLCVASGPEHAIEALEKTLASASRTFRRLQTSHAFHSAMMEPVIAPFTALLQAVHLNEPRLPFVSNLTATWITSAEATSPAYWAQHLRQAVRFAAGVGVLLDKAEHVLLEVGPGGTLTTLSRQHPARKATHVIVPSLPAGPNSPSETATLLGALGRVWQAGVDVDWKGFSAGEVRRKVSLPGYPFERKRFFIEPGLPQQPTVREAATPALVTAAVGTIPGAAVTPISHRERILVRIREKLGALSGLGEEEMPATRTFLEMGFDSLFLSQVGRAIEAEFGVAVTFRQLADDLSSISRLADHLEAKLPDDGAAPGAASAGGDGATSQAVDLVLPLTDAQHEIWLAAQLGADLSRTYNESYLIRLTGSLQIDSLRESLQEVVDRHDVLRASFSTDGSSQTIAAHVAVDVPVQVVEGRGTEQEQELERLVRVATTHVFDLHTAPLFRTLLFDLGRDRHALLIVIHHLVADGWSWGVILQELGEAYTGRSEGRPVMNRPTLQYRDYVAWASSSAQQARVAAAEAYWIARLADKPEEIELPSDRSRPSRKTYGAGRVRHEFDRALVGRLRETARTLNCTVFHLLMASFNVWLHRVTGREDLVVAVPTAGQIAAGLGELQHADRLVGHCVNMLPVRTTCTRELPFRQLVQNTKTSLLDARQHQDIAFNDLVNALEWPRDPSRVPLASVSLNLGLAHQPRFGALDAQTSLPPKAFNFFDLTADVLDGDGSLVADVKFNADLCDRTTVERWIAQWERVLAAGIDALDASIDELAIVPEDEQRRLLVEWNATAREYPRNTCVHQLFDQQAQRTPDRLAVACDGARLTYRDLDQRANRLARRLIDLGVGPEVLVGVCLERGVDMVVALLAVLKAGGAYVPLDPAYPAERIQFVIDDAQAPVMITQDSLSQSLGSMRTTMVCLDRDATTIGRFDGSPIPARASATDRAYVIYTSGSTGQPKGVQIEHRAVVNFLLSMQREPGLRPDDVLLAVTTLSFDIAGLEVFLPLVTGAQVVIAPRDTTFDGFALARTLETAGVTVMQATPATWRLLLAAGWEGRKGLKILCGGEALPRDLVEALLPRCGELWNVYGPTETTIWSTCCRVTDPNEFHIGRPIDNTQIRIVDPGLRPVPIGVAGELLIGGDGLARGYANRAELTAERFVDLPGEPGHRFYRTGDLARYRPDGNIDCLGRLDFQVKVRGFRVELGEIEAVLLQHDALANAVVVATRDSAGEGALVAYCVQRPDSTVDSETLRRHLELKLPEYMVPALFVFMPALPTTPNGKIDRRALPEPAFTAAAEARVYEAPTTPTEAMLCEVFADVLHVTQIGVNDDFFRLGGRSLEAVRAVSRIRQALGIEVPVVLLFEFSGVAALAQRLVVMQAGELGDAELAALLDDIEAGSHE